MYALAMRRQKPDDAHGQWQLVSRWGFVVLARDLAELRQFVRFLGPRVGFPPGDGVIDQRYEDALLRGPFRRHDYGAPTGHDEMTFGELVADWVPGPEQVVSRRSSPGITDAWINEAQRGSLNAVVADALAMSIGGGQ